MKKIQTFCRKKAIVFGVVLLFFCTLVPLNASAQTMVIQPSRSGGSPLQGPDSGLFLIYPPIPARLGWIPTLSFIQDWSDKPFSNTTLMFIGSGVGFRPLIPVQFILYSFEDPAPEKVQVYLDGDSFVTLRGISIPPTHPLVTMYGFSFSKKGFHHLKFVPDDNESATVYIDIQVGVQGFTKNILPYLHK